METLENITALFCVMGLFGLFMCAFWAITVYPFCRWHIQRGKNKIQWRAVKTSKTESDAEYRLQYRVMPSELSKFVRIYGSNEWRSDGILRYFNSEVEFVEFARKYDTLKKVGHLLNGEDVQWIYPPTEK